jgi:hypothetical protein
MATYGDSASEYPYKPLQKKRKQKYSIITRVINFANLPVTSSYVDNERFATTAWAAGDVLEAVKIRAGQTVLAVQMELLTHSTDAGDIIDIGYGDDTDRWGRYSLKGDAVTTNENVKNTYTSISFPPDEWWNPLYFSASDSIDITVGKAAIQGKIRLIVHLLEDDR